MSGRKTVAVAALGVTLATAASAMAAHPKKGKLYAGPTSGLKYNGFRPVASFTVSADGTKLLHFMYQSFGCGGFGGPTTPGVDYYMRAYAEHKMGGIAVKADGTFKLKNHKSTYSSHGYTTVTTSTVSGHFKSRDKAVGTITLTQQNPKIPGSVCGPVRLSFTATVRPS